MTDPLLRRLPRSLDPLTDETLSGYLLRLAHRLRIDPAHLVRRTGLTGKGAGETKFFRVPMNLVFDLDERRKQLFADTTRLSTGEVEGLLLAGLGNRYGPLNPRFSTNAASSRVIHNNPWVLTEAIRYCSDCLAGDGSEVESLHGGAWRRGWRLPVVFACVRHRRLLRDRCPSCSGLVQADNGNSMIARMNDDALLPTQCRSTPDVPGTRTRGARPACGVNLTLPGDNDFDELSPRTRRVILSTQERLDSLLAGDGPEQVGSAGQAVPVAQYFIDLRVVTALIFMAWPETGTRAATPELALALGEEARRRQLDYAERSAIPGKQASATKSYSDPPATPLVAAAVFEMADRLLRSPDKATASAALGPLAAEARYVSRKVSYSIRRGPGISIPLQAALLAHR